MAKAVKKKVVKKVVKKAPKKSVAKSKAKRPVTKKTKLVKRFAKKEVAVLVEGVSEQKSVLPENAEVVSDEELDEFFDDDYPEEESDYDAAPKEDGKVEPAPSSEEGSVQESSDEDW